MDACLTRACVGDCRLMWATAAAAAAAAAAADDDDGGGDGDK